MVTRISSQSGSSWQGFSVKLGFELTVIVVGILIALAIDQWRTEQENRDLEQEYLHRLIADMESNINKAESLMRYQQNIVENARKVFPLMHSGAESNLEAADVVTAAYWASAIESPNWNDATHQELLSSGRYVILESAILRGELLQFYEQIVPTRQMFDLASTNYREAIRSEFNPELQVGIRQNCDRFEGACNLDTFATEIDQHVSWMRGNSDLARKLGRVIPQSERGIEYATRIKEASLSLIGLLEAETKAN